MVRSAAAESNAFMIECENALPHELLGNKSTDDPSKPAQESKSAEHQPGLDSSSGDDYVEVVFDYCLTTFPIVLDVGRRFYKRIQKYGEIWAFAQLLHYYSTTLYELCRAHDCQPIAFKPTCAARRGFDFCR